MVGVGVGDEQGSEKWIAQIAALLDKMPSVGQISFFENTAQSPQQCFVQVSDD